MTLTPTVTLTSMLVVSAQVGVFTPTLAHTLTSMFAISAQVGALEPLVVFGLRRRGWSARSSACCGPP